MIRVAKYAETVRAQNLYEQGGGSVFSVPTTPHHHHHHHPSLSLVNHTVSVDAMHHDKEDVERNKTLAFRLHELRESRGGRPGLSVLMGLTVSVDVKQH